MTLKTRLSVLLLSTPVLAFVVIGGLMGRASAGSDDQTFQHLRVFEDVVSLVLNNYVEEVKADRVMEGAMRGLADGLDPDSAYLNAQQVRDIEAKTPLPEGEVGLELTRQFYLRVIAARDGSPAAKAGLQTGDYVRVIDGKATRDLSVFEGARLLRGAPGSKVTLTIIRGNAADPHEVVLVREKPAGTAVSGRLIGDTGYVRIASFRAPVAADVQKQVADLSKAGAKALVLDVRHTAEGAYEHAIAAARLFVKSGTIAIQGGRSRTDAPVEFTAKPGDGAITLPAAVLVTAGSTGPSELFAAALKDNKRAELIGEHTLGRAGLQKLVKLPENRGLWLTYARFFRPANIPVPATAAAAQPAKKDGPAPKDAPKAADKNAAQSPGSLAIHGRGLEPDVAVEEPDVEFGSAAPASDPILDAAIERLKAKKAA
jgi:carboxyl-terminal processing protease